MKTIEERAKEWGEHIVETTPYDVVNGKVCVFVEDRDIANVAEESYIAGATEQKAIDVDKACEWLKNNWREYVNQDRDGMILFGHWESDFRKAMEEKDGQD